MLSQGGGAIVNVSSIAGFLGGRSGAAYTVAKHGVIGLTRSIAVYYGNEGIRCNAVCPGVTDTNIVTDPSTLDPRGLEVVMSVVGGAPPAAQPAQMASVIAFLASDAASYVNGMVMTADRGWTAA
jgi:NAD(P)-dependent dehydrogenase (short-subunit alcohol dehydrogenase family)